MSENLLSAKQKELLREAFFSPKKIAKGFGCLGWHEDLAVVAELFFHGGPKVKHLRCLDSERPVRYTYLAGYQVCETGWSEFQEDLVRYISYKTRITDTLPVPLRVRDQRAA